MPPAFRQPAAAEWPRTTLIHLAPPSTQAAGGEHLPDNLDAPAFAVDRPHLAHVILGTVIVSGLAGESASHGR